MGGQASPDGIRAIQIDEAAGDAELAAQLAIARSDAGCRVLVLFGVEHLGIAPSSDEAAASLAGLAEAIHVFPAPVVAAIEGTVSGAGVSIAAACDIIVASDGVSFCFPEIAAGRLPASIGLARLLPARMVRYLALTGDAIAALDMHRLGGIDRVVPRGHAFSEARSLAASLTEKSPTALRLLKQSMNLTQDLPLQTAQNVEVLFTTIAASTPDGREAARAFLEKRKPVWSSEQAS